ncbi:MAG: ribonuclease E/G [Lachnospiraceae bacterium]|nr:ribonuclease E/G [Lachnospiraceae bacterium]
MEQTVIFTDVEKQRGFFSIIDSKLHLASFDTGNKRDIDKIFIGKITNIMPNLKAAFVEYQKGVSGFLPLRTEELKQLKCNTFFPVQVEKDAIKTKEAVLSRELSLKGLYCIVTSSPGGIHFSKKLSLALQENIRESLQPLVDPALSYIIRSNAAALWDHAPENDEMGMPSLEFLIKEAEELSRQLKDLLTKSESRTMYSLMYPGSPFYISQLSKIDLLQTGRIVTDSKEDFDSISQSLPRHLLPKLSLYEDASFPLQALHSLKGKLKEAVSRTVWLKSGGYLVIEPTEALTVIDVNSGKNIKKMSKAALCKLTNQEAAEAIPYILTSRNLTGIILVDFISTNSKKEDEKLLKQLRVLTAKDYVKTDVVDITPLGLVEITRQKRDIPLQDQLREAGIYEAIKS